MSIDRAAESTAADPASATHEAESSGPLVAASEDDASGRTDSGSIRQRLRLAAITIGLLSMAVRASVLRDAYFITDDYMLSARAVENELTFDYLTRVHTGHFEPIGFLVMWLHAHYAPYSWGWAAVFLLGCQVLLLILVWQLLVEVFGPRLLVLAPYALFAFSPLTIAAFTWLAAGIIWLPLMISMAGMMRYHVRYVRDRRTRDAVIALLWFTVGLASFEKILIILPFLAVLTLALEQSFGRDPKRVVSIVLSQWRLWAGYTVLTIGYLALYIRGSGAEGATSALQAPTAADLGDFVVQTLGRTFIPGTLGGPWDWAIQSYGLAVVDSPRFFDWLAWAVIILVIVGSLALRRGAALYWAAMATYLGASMAIIALGRVAYLGPVFALETRYLADAVLPMVLILGVMLMPLVGEVDPLTKDGARVGAWRPYLRLPVIGAATGTVVVLSLHALSGYSTYSSNNHTDTFVANVREGLAELPAGAQIVDTWMPDNVLSPFFGEYNRTSRFLAPLVDDEHRQELYTRVAYTMPYVIADDGRIVPMVVEPYATATNPGLCRSQRGGEVTVPLTQELHAWDWVVRLGYLSEADFTATLQFGSKSATVPMVTGLGGVYVTLNGDGGTLQVTDIPPLTNFCIGDVTVGTAAPQQS